MPPPADLYPGSRNGPGRGLNATVRDYIRQAFCFASTACVPQQGVNMSAQETPQSATGPDVESTEKMGGFALKIGDGSASVGLECPHQNGLLYMVPGDRSWVCEDDLRCVVSTWNLDKSPIYESCLPNTLVKG